jgi:ActR/RegA family two-component response regulator
MLQGRLLIVEDDEVLLRAQARFLRHGGLTDVLSTDHDAPLAILRTTPLDVIVADLDSYQTDALELVACIHTMGLGIPVS